MTRPHCLPAAELASRVEEAGARTAELVADLHDEQLLVPLAEIVNPFLWELGHVSFFYEAFVLRTLGDREPLLAGADGLYDSFAVEHDTRWVLSLPSRQATLDYVRRVSERVIGRLDHDRDPAPRETYLYLLGVAHEDMHAEAFTYMRQTLGYRAPPVDAGEAHPEVGGGPCPGDVQVPGGTVMLGADPRARFVFDNEKWAHAAEVAPFRIARAPVTNLEFAEFVEDGGYLRRELWSCEGWQWRTRVGAEHPATWQRGVDGWLRRDFDRMLPLEEHAPVVHVTWFEAEAWCRWAARRLPTEAEWELAASLEPAEDGAGLEPHRRRYPWGAADPDPLRCNLDWRAMGCVEVGAHPAGDSDFGCRQMIGNVWEWTASAFYPFPGYVVDEPYREYSAPWFGDRKVLRGGCWATRSRLIRTTYRNFFLPHRNDVFAGFRTCAL